MSESFSCGELDSLGCSCGGCCSDTAFAPPPPPLVLQAVSFGPYFNYQGNLDVRGTVRPVATSGRRQTFRFDLQGIGPRCAGGAGPKPNSCGLHIHTAKTCRDAAGGHFYRQDGRADPWSTVAYKATAGGRANGTHAVETGEDAASILGRPFVVHDFDGARVACALLTAAEPQRECLELPPILMPIGVLMGVFGSIGINIGQNLQADGIQSLPPSLRESAPHQSPKWRVGMALFISFSIVNFAALAFAPASVLVPLESIQFVTNVCYSALVHHKKVPPRMLWGVALASMGTVFTVVFGASGGGCHTLEQLSGSWSSPIWWTFVALSLVVAFASLRIHVVYDRQLLAGGQPYLAEYVQPVTFALTAALLGGSQMIVQSKVSPFRQANRGY